MTRPNNGSVTRAGGVIDIYIWVACVINGLVEYAEPIGCAHSDDGTTYNVHKLTDEDYYLLPDGSLQPASAGMHSLISFLL